MKILAIGATGFIGSRVTHQLMAQGHQVALFHRGSTTASDLDSVLHFHGTRHQLPNFKAVYGPGDEQHRFLAYLQQMFDQQPILLDEKQAHWRFSHGYVGLAEKISNLGNRAAMGLPEREDSATPW
ncbi:NAD-dependent epimerase/dehydratase family protein [Nodosilinea sp. E11]|uniref:NAD-dependent epimerase/dehydratase family protein n=1 Tax=Nodosilinea sp. E11 TaxID=3037479 RepID=UPI0029351FD2|nr:NAD-dependent epimerase/dehydratase family protein [Nodosilinea sp. E11]WOD39802.1 NAD-dependent epimerase/dehydratase family protein [Nodosilinea sp. E11]